MTDTITISTLAACMVLATACTFGDSKRETCAKWSSGQITESEAIKRLSLAKASEYWKIRNYCEFYKD